MVSLGDSEYGKKGLLWSCHAKGPSRANPIEPAAWLYYEDLTMGFPVSFISTVQLWKHHHSPIAPRRHSAGFSPLRNHLATWS